MKFAKSILVLALGLILVAGVFAGGGQQAAPAPAAAGKSSDPSKAPEGYPRRALTGIIPWDAGGATDIATRQFMAAIGKELKQDINPINITGGMGAIGVSDALSRPADGYTIAILQYDVLTNNITKVTKDSYKDFALLCMFTLQGSNFFVRADRGWKTFADFVEGAKKAGAAGKKLQLSVSGLWYHGGGLMLKAAGIADYVTMIPQPGSGGMLTEILGDHVDGMISSLAIALPHIQAGTLNWLGTMLEKRLDAYPDIPTFVELGYPSVVQSSFRMLAVHKDTPKDIVEYLRYVARKAWHDDAQFLPWAREARADPVFMDAAESERFLENLSVSVTQVMKDLGIIK